MTSSQVRHWSSWLAGTLTVFVVGACGGRTSEAPPPTDPPTGIASTQPAGNGPGLRRQPAAALKLPVPRTFDLSHVAPVHFAAALGKDPSRIFAYVRDHIAFEPYAGSLRGPRGTLMAMAGNSVDRATLVGKLLQESGFNVRYVRGTLTDSRARQLVDSVWAGRPQLQSPSAAVSSELTEISTKVIATIERDTALLRNTLRGAGLPAADPSPLTLESLVNQTRNHYWVEWRKDNAWIAMDPSFGDSVPGQAPAKVEETFNELPAALFHRVEIRIRLEEYAGDKRSSREVLRYAAAAADLSGTDLILTHEAVDPKTQGSSVKPLLHTGQQSIGGSEFWLKPPPSGHAEMMLDALSGGADDAVPLATAEFVDIDFFSPDGAKQSVVREIFDRIGGHRRRTAAASPEWIAAAVAGTSSEELASAVYTLFVTTGGIDLEHLSDLADAPPSGDDEPVDVGAALRRICVAFAAISDATTSRIPGPSGSVWRTFLDTSRVQIAEFVPTDRALRIGLDLRRDPGLTIVTGFRPDQLFLGRLVRGVINGTLERFVMEQSMRGTDARPWPGRPILSTSALFERAGATAVPTVLLVRDDSDVDPAVSADARERIGQALAAGNVVVAPRRPIDVEGVPRLAWWQVDPRSGATIAVTDEGLHQATVELRIIEHKDHVTVVHWLPKSRQVFIPRAGRMFSTPAQAEAYCESLVQQLASRGISGLWGWISVL